MINQILFGFCLQNLYPIKLIFFLYFCTNKSKDVLFDFNETCGKFYYFFKKEKRKKEKFTTQFILR